MHAMKMKKRYWLIPLIIVGLVPYVFLVVHILKPSDESASLRLADCSKEQCASQITELRSAIAAYDPSVTIKQLSYHHREEWFDGTSDELTIVAVTSAEKRSELTGKLVELAWKSEVYPLEVASIAVLTGDDTADNADRGEIYWFVPDTGKKKNPLAEKYGERKKGQLSSSR